MVKPNFSNSEVLEIALSNYNIAGFIKEIPSYDDQNFLITKSDGNEFVLKIASLEEKRSNLELQNAALEHLDHFPIIKIPKLIKNEKNERITNHLDSKSQKYYIRLFSYIPGVLLADIPPLSSQFTFNIGKRLGHFSSSLENFSFTKKVRDFKWNFSLAQKYINLKIEYIHELTKKNVVIKFKKYYLSLVFPELDELRSSVIHNDWNDYNIIINNLNNDSEFDLGVIDFGDMHYGIIISELAVALTYIMLDQEDPLLTAFHVVKGYHSEFPLKENELQILFPLICTRIALSLCNSAYQIFLDPNNDYLTISENPIWELAKKIEQIPPQFAYQTFFDACHPGLTKEEILKLRSQYVGPNLSVSYQTPLKITRGFMQYLYDDEGNRYLDCVNNIPHVGHSHPEIIEVINKQASVLNTNTRYLHDLIVQYAKRLSDTLPDPLSVCYFVNSGSEANELALRLAYNYTKQRDMIVIEGGYHGNTQSLIDISSYKFNGKGGSGPPSHVHTVPVPDTYRGQYKRDNLQAGKKYADFVKETINNLKKDGKGIAGFISESIMSSGGQIIYPGGYLKEVYNYVRDYGGVCIADEVQVGFGRVGSHFWGFETQGVIPDIVTIGKPMANGHPMGAVITTRKIAEAFDNGMEFFSSFGGNPISCAIALKVLDILKKKDLQKNALKIGNQLISRLAELKDKYSIIGDVRGIGLFIGIEMVLERSPLQPADIITKDIVEKMKDHGILVSVDGLLKNVIKIKPPMVFNVENVEKLVGTLEKVLEIIY